MNKPITGIAILEKVDRDAETMTEKAIHPVSSVTTKRHSCGIESRARPLFGAKSPKVIR